MGGIRSRTQPSGRKRHVAKSSRQRSSKPRPNGCVSACGRPSRAPAALRAASGKSVLCQLGDQIGRDRHQVCPCGNWSRWDRLLQPRLPRPYQWVAIADRGQDLPRRLRPAFARLYRSALQRSRRTRSSARGETGRGIHCRTHPGQRRQHCCRRLSALRVGALPQARQLVCRRRNVRPDWGEPDDSWRASIGESSRTLFYCPSRCPAGRSPPAPC